MIKLMVNISKKIPGPVDFSSIQASCSIECLCASSDPVSESANLYRQAELAVNSQLGIQASVSRPVNGRSFKKATPIAEGVRRILPVKKATPAQLNYLSTLLNTLPGEEDKILSQEGLETLDQLSSRACSAAISRLANA